jgi:DNA-binding MarR family transcriptional regulator
MSKEIELLTEIRDLVQVMAEPALAKHYEKLREALRGVVGKSKKKASAALLMDGSISQAAIVKETGIDQSDLSKLVKALKAESLIATDEGHPKLRIKVLPNFFDHGGKSDE